MPETWKIAIASDHRGIFLKKHILNHFDQLNLNGDTKNVFLDIGPYLQSLNTEPQDIESVDYPDYARKACEAFVRDGYAHKVVLICGTGIGMCIAANKIKHIRAAVVQSEEQARMCRLHNHANTLCLGSNHTTPHDAIRYVTIWLETDFDPQPRHQRRLQKLRNFDAQS